MDYTGIREVSLTQEELAQFYQGDFPILDLLENQYVFLRDETGKIVDKFFWREGHLERVPFIIFSSDFVGKIKPRNPEQECAFHLLHDQNIRVKLITGRFGSGKSMSMIAQAVEALDKGIVDKVVYVRNNITVRDTAELGFLPGGEVDKLLPYLMQFADHVGGKEALIRMISEEKLEPIHLGYLRGRDIRNSIIYVTEAQNLTADHIKLLLGRVGEGSYLYLDGDFHAQIDRSVFERSPGLKRMIEVLAGNRLFGYVNLVKSERSEVSALADLLDEN